jgi:hypothetical protein
MEGGNKGKRERIESLFIKKDNNWQFVQFSLQQGDAVRNVASKL